MMAIKSRLYRERRGRRYREARDVGVERPHMTRPLNVLASCALALAHTSAVSREGQETAEEVHEQEVVFVRIIEASTVMTRQNLVEQFPNLFLLHSH